MNKRRRSPLPQVVAVKLKIPSKKLLIRYREFNGWELETWSQYYFCDNDKHLKQFLFLEKFLSLFQQHFERKHRGHNNIDHCHPVNVLATKFSIRREDADLEIKLHSSSSYKYSKICELVADEIPQYRELVDFLLKYEIIYTGEAEQDDDEWIKRLDNLMTTNKDVISDVFNGILYKKFGDCSSKDDYHLIKLSPDDEGQ